MREVIATGKTVEEAIEDGCRQLGLTRDEASVEILEMPARKLFKTVPATVKVSAIGEDEHKTPAETKAVAKEVHKNVKETPSVQPAAQAAKPVAEKPHESQQSRRGVLPEEPEEEIVLSENPVAQAAVDYLTSIFSAMGAQSVQITAVKQGDATLLRVEGDSIREVVETKGETIQALSYLTDRAVNKGIDKKDDNYLRIRLDIAGYRGRRENELISLATRTGKEVERTKRSRTLAPMNPYERLIIHTTISSMEGLTSESIGTDTERRVVIKSTAADATDGEDWRPPRKGGNNRGGRGGNNRGGSNNRNNSRGTGNNRRPQGNNKPYSSGPRPDRQENRSSTPEREYADKQRDPNAKPIVPQRRDAIKDGEDLPLYGKIEL